MNFTKNKINLNHKQSLLVQGSVVVAIIFIGLKILGLLFIFLGGKMVAYQSINEIKKITNNTSSTPTPISIPKSKILPTDYHVFQSFNNCGPAALSMALHFYGLNISQDELGKAIRPYQIPNGDDDDKSVTLDELGEKSKEYGFIYYHRPMGNSKIIKEFIAQGIPVITRTWTKPTEDIGHYRVIKGYDDNTQTFLQDDSLQGKNLTYTYNDFNELWKKFNYEYLVLVPKDMQNITEQIMGENNDNETAWKNAVKNSLNELSNNPDDIYARFNLSVAYYNIKDYQKSVEEFEKVENLLPFRTLWYQIEPIESYFQLGNYDRVFSITDKILNNNNRAFSELYILRGKSYQKLGNLEAARGEYEKAVFYNQSLKEAKSLIGSL